MAGKNVLGELGERCKMCSGMGFTLSITDGGSRGCMRCDQTGVEPVNSHVLQKQIDSLTNIVKNMGKSNRKSSKKK